MRVNMKCLALLALAGAGCATMGSPGEHAVIRAKNKVIPSLVHIRPVKETFASGQKQEYVVEGSGFLISPDGYVVTNEHVAGDSSLVRCVLYNRDEIDAEVVGTDRYTDIAVLKLKSSETHLPAAELGNSAHIEPGQTVLALGSPHGLSRSISKGIVSVTDRYLGEEGPRPAPYNTWIQTDAAINPGNSGGPLVNLKGEVIGINTRKLSGADNVGFAIPVNAAREVIEAIIDHGYVPRSWIGIRLQEMTSKTDDPTQRGVVVADIDPLGPAAAAGFVPGDVITAVNNAPIHARFEEDLPPVLKRIADLPIGTPASFSIRRGEETQAISVVTMEESDYKGNEVEFSEWGFAAAGLTPAIVQAARLPSSQGIVIAGIEVGSAAAGSGLRQGDIVLSVDGKEITGLAEFQAFYDEINAAAKRFVLLDVKRGALTRFELLKLEPGADDEDATPGELMTDEENGEQPDEDE
ncbi:MAG: trypsin-like peptidase domain-containing protein [Candidatus Hydrogenedentales bacterium]